MMERREFGVFWGGAGREEVHAGHVEEQGLWEGPWDATDTAWSEARLSGGWKQNLDSLLGVYKLRI